jgi:hypothetical protein
MGYFSVTDYYFDNTFITYGRAKPIAGTRRRLRKFGETEGRPRGASLGPQLRVNPELDVFQQQPGGDSCKRSVDSAWIF